MRTELWPPRIERAAGPVYLAITDALDIRTGLGPGARPPPQHTLADALEIDFTTVSRASIAIATRRIEDRTAGAVLQAARKQTPDGGYSDSARQRGPRPNAI